MNMDHESNTGDGPECIEKFHQAKQEYVRFFPSVQSDIEKMNLKIEREKDLDLQKDLISVRRRLVSRLMKVNLIIARIDKRLAVIQESQPEDVATN